MKKRMLLMALVAGMTMTAVAEERSAALFKVVSTRDEITVGLPDADADAIAKVLVRDGYLRLWQFALARGADGAVVQKAQREVVILGAQVVRIEPLTERGTLPR